MRERSFVDHNNAVEVIRSSYDNRAQTTQFDSAEDMTSTTVMLNSLTMVRQNWLAKMSRSRATHPHLDP